MTNKQHRIIIAGYGVPGVYGIEGLFANGIEPHSIRVWTYPNDARNEVLHAFARGHGIELVTFEANSEAAFNWIKQWEPTVLFSLHFRDRISEQILSIPSVGSVNLHPSLLPRYRGCFSAPWAIINGERFTGVTFHYMVKKFDAGRIVVQKEVPISSHDTGFSLFHRLITEAFVVFPDVVKKVVFESYQGVEQQSGGEYYSRKVPFNGIVDLAWDRDRIERFIRAMYFPPFKGAVVKNGDLELEVSTLEDFDRVMKEMENVN